ncbi:hypothetical protein DFP72DRAFT_1068752 [Ephemerocybe angulata]|uniref:Uncharacterized protein n=1 Tax=Ephemerocybe angulata TaxID=980116 RepID=A0A8H6HWQ7_9AGAR|nr:hypothetical protein DFP72DRAFT_1068752 [Tulosesus angulatus]
MAWLQREGLSNRASRGSIFGHPGADTIAEEEEPKTEGPPEEAASTTAAEGKVEAAVSAARAALEEASAVATEASSTKLSVTASNANPKPESVRPESSFEEIRVAKKQYFRTSKARIIGVFIPPTSPPNTIDGSPTRLPVDDRDSVPPTPVQTRDLLDHTDNAITLASPGVAPGTVSLSATTNPGDHHTWTPSHHANFSSSTLPLKIEKKGRKNSLQAGDSTESLPPKTPVSAPAAATKEFIVPKGTVSNAASRETLKARNRGKLVRTKSTPAVDMQQLRAFIASRDGAGRPFPDQSWQPRPLISHAKTASRSSGCSLDSNTTYNPPSTIDYRENPRISISSTIYNSSNDYHSSLPNTANQPAFPPLSPNAPSFIGSYNTSSEEGEFNPDAYPRNDILHEIQSEQIIDSDNYQLMSILAGTNMLRSRSRSPKPPVPRTPKPIFSRKPLSEQSSPTESPVATSLIFEGYLSNDSSDPPPTTNWLGQEERADLVRKSRKLARVFGRTPGADVMAYQDGSRSTSQARGKVASHQRAPLSISNDLNGPAGPRNRRASAWPSPTDSHFSTNSGSRRHSLPLSPDDISFLNVSSPLYDISLSQVASQFRGESSNAGTPSASRIQAQEPLNDRSAVTHHSTGSNKATHNGTSSPSRTSFIDWSDEEGLDDGLSIISQEPPRKAGGNRRPTSPAHSFFENMTPEEQAEEEKRRKREKLAKLHRFLGSTVPVNLVVGTDTENTMPVQPTRPYTDSATARGRPGSDQDEATRKAWLRRRRSSSACALPSHWSDDVDRMKEELNTKEKLLNVRRAQKMEKVFGVAPPQTLYHTRGHTPSPSLPSMAPVAGKTLGNPSAFIPASDAMYFTRNPNRSSYDKSSANSKLSRRRTNGRPSTAESSKQLIPKGRRSSSTTSFNFGGSPPTNAYEDQSRYSCVSTARSGPSYPHDQPLAASAVYNHYQHSLNSLNDILDRDDCESLVELHHYLNNEPTTDLLISVEQEETYTSRLRGNSDAASILTERRLSLPAASTASLVSDQHSVFGHDTVPKGGDLTDFQMRRRRAAKLTQFFGVQYRELINDVLDSLENGLEHEQKRGTLQADEIADLLDRLRDLKVKREGITG